MTTLDPALCADGCGRLAETERPTADGRTEEVCREHAAVNECWCGGEVGPRTPGDAQGLGCLADITHDWAWACRNCEDIDPGSWHSLDRFCLRDKCAPGCEFIAPHPEHPCGRYPSGEHSSNPREDG